MHGGDVDINKMMVMMMMVMMMMMMMLMLLLTKPMPVPIWSTCSSTAGHVPIGSVQFDPTKSNYTHDIAQSWIVKLD